MLNGVFIYLINRNHNDIKTWRIVPSLRDLNTSVLLHRLMLFLFFISEAINTNPPFDLHLLREIPNRIVTTCEKTLNSRKEIIDWFEDVMAKKVCIINLIFLFQFW